MLDLEGKSLTKPKETSLVKGTNEERRAKVTTPLVEKVYHKPQEPVQTYDNNSFCEEFENEDDPNWIPF